MSSLLRESGDLCGLEHRLGSGASVVLGCSALKESYRLIMQEGLSRIDFVFLDVDQLTLTERLGRRQAHFFPKGLLESQFAALERPQNALIVDARRSIEEVKTFPGASLGPLSLGTTILTTDEMSSFVQQERYFLGVVSQHSYENVSTNGGGNPQPGFLLEPVAATDNPGRAAPLCSNRETGRASPIASMK
jgi:hypothetical protein